MGMSKRVYDRLVRIDGTIQEMQKLVRNIETHALHRESFAKQHAYTMKFF